VKRLSDQTLYEILEVSVDAPPEEIERAHARASALYGPGSLATYTLVTPDEALLLNNRIEEARAVLLDPESRARYDERIGVRPPTSPPPLPASMPAPSPLATAPPSEPATTPWPPPAAVPLPQAPIALDHPVREGGPEGGAGPAPGELPPPAPPSPGLGALTPSPVAAGAVAPPIPLRNEVTAPRDLLVPEGAAWTGAMLRQVREARGLSVALLSERTKVTRHHLENIEADRFGALPAPVYLRGILMSLARELRLDGQKVARSYLERASTEPPSGRSLR
jgi:hypothetical protein